MMWRDLQTLQIYPSLRRLQQTLTCLGMIEPLCENISSCMCLGAPQELGTLALGGGRTPALQLLLPKAVDATRPHDKAPFLHKRENFPRT